MSGLARWAAGSFENVPDSYGGAYVFRNGFVEALARSTPMAHLGDDPPPTCRFHWNVSEFIPVVR